MLLHRSFPPARSATGNASVTASTLALGFARSFSHMERRRSVLIVERRSVGGQYVVDRQSVITVRRLGQRHCEDHPGVVLRINQGCGYHCFRGDGVLGYVLGR